MAVSYSATEIQFNSTSPTPNDLDDVVAAGGCTLVIPEARCYVIQGIQLHFLANSHFKDSEFTLYHSKEASWSTNRAFWWDGTSGTVTWGEGDLTDPLVPITFDDAHYFYDNLTTPGNVFWSYHTYGAMSEGKFRQYGGIFECLPRGSTSNGQFLYYPMTETHLIQIHFERWGGHRTWGTNYAVREVICKGGANASPGSTSGPYGFSMGGITAVEDAMFDIVIENNCYGYYFYDDNGGELRNARLRNNNSDLNRNTTVSGLEVHLIDCTPYGDISGSGSGWIYEETSYNFKTLQEDGVTPISTVSYYIWRENPSKETIRLEYTDAQGEPESGEILLLNTSSNNTTYPPNSFGPYFIRVRDFGREYIELKKITDPPSPLIDNFLMVETGTTVGGTDPSTVSAYTGIGQDDGAHEIAVTQLHSLQEVFSWCQWHNAKTLQITDIATLPFQTLDNALYEVISPWVMTGVQDFVELERSILEEADGDRWVPVYLSGLVPYARISIRKQSDNSEVYGALASTLTWEDKYFWPQTDLDVVVRVRLQGYIFYEASRTITSVGLSISVNLTEDPLYNYYVGRVNQTHFRWRDDDGSEKTATWLQSEDVDHTGLAKGNNVRIRLQKKEIKGQNVNKMKPQLEYRKVGDKYWTKVKE